MTRSARVPVPRAVAIVALLCSAARADAQTGRHSRIVADTVRCFLADRPLRSGTADTMPLRFDRPNAWAWSIGLLEGGRLQVGTIEKPWARWRRSGDTLVIVTSSLDGWRIAVTPVPDTRDSLYVGIATYVTDVVVEGWRPPWTTVTLLPHPCPRR